MRRPHLTRLLLGGLALALIAGLFIPRMDGNADALQGGMELSRPRPLSAWPEPLLTDEGEAFELNDFQGKNHLLFFGFAGCPDICPNTLLLASQVYAGLTEAERDALQITLVSVDPERDSPEKLHDYVGHFHPDFRALTGPMASIESLAEQAGIAFIKVPQENGYTVDHSAAMVFLDANAQIRAYFAPPLERELLIADLGRLMGKKK